MRTARSSPLVRHCWDDRSPAGRPSVEAGRWEALGYLSALRFSYLTSDYGKARVNVFTGSSRAPHLELML
jgi:hypothetical protein